VAVANEFVRNREAAAETRRRNMTAREFQNEEGNERRRSSYAGGEERKAEVRRRAQEERDGKDAVHLRELERARQEYLEDMRRARLRLLEQQSGGAAKAATATSEDWTGHEDAGEDNGEQPTMQEDQSEHLRALERARQENEEDRRRLAEKSKTVRFSDEAVEAGSCDDVPTDEDEPADEGHSATSSSKRPAKRSVTIETLAAVPEEPGMEEVARKDEVDLELGADIRELIIPFTDKVRPKPVLSSDSRPMRRTRSQGATEPGSAGAGGSSSSTAPAPSGAAGRGGGRGGRRGAGGRGGHVWRGAPAGANDADPGGDGSASARPGQAPTASAPSTARHASGPPPAGPAPLGRPRAGGTSDPSQEKASRLPPPGQRLQRASGTPAQWMRSPPAAASEWNRSATGAGGPASPPRSPPGAAGASAFSSAAAALGATIAAAAAGVELRSPAAAAGAAIVAAGAGPEPRMTSRAQPSPTGDGDVTQLQGVLASALCGVEGKPSPGEVPHGQSAAPDWNDTLGWGDTLQLGDTLSYTADSGLGVDALSR